MVLVGIGGLLLTIGAVALEVVSSNDANSAVPRWSEWVPLAWPRPLRVMWWLTVAAAAWSFRWSLGQLGVRPNRLVTVLTVGPFAMFASGVALGADWATWH